MTLEDYLLAADALRANPVIHIQGETHVVARAFDSAMPDIAQRAFRDGVGLDYFRQMISDLLNLIDAFYMATRKSLPASANNNLWVHQKIGLFENLDPRNDVDINKVKEIAERYIASPFIENDYFNWCLLDCLIFSQIKMFARVMASTQFGSAPANPAYFASKGDPSRYRLLKPVFFVLGLVANYLTPALIGYYAIEHGHEFIGGLFYAISAAGVFSFLLTYKKRQAARERNEALLEKVLELYAALNAGDYRHARFTTLLEQARTLGVRFDKIIPAIAGMKRTQADEGLAEALFQEGSPRP